MFHYSKEVQAALKDNHPIVALESTIITHGFPYPSNLEMARAVEDTIRQQGAIPATIALIEGDIKVGLTASELERLASCSNATKASTRELAIASALKQTAGTTVASTMLIAARVGIRYFATGGIGGVHLGAPYDVSHDLLALSHYPVAVICAGPKAILDIPKTLEYLETQGVPVVSYRSRTIPAFYSRDTPWPAPCTIDTPMSLAHIVEAHLALHQQRSGLLITNPIPEQHAIPFDEIEPVIQQAITEAQQQGVTGKALTPFLLARLNELTSGRSVEANRALVINNTTLAAQLAATRVPSVDKLS